MQQLQEISNPKLVGDLLIENGGPRNRKSETQFSTEPMITLYADGGANRPRAEGERKREYCVCGHQ